MADLKTICFGSNCMDNSHPMLRDLNTTTVTVPNNTVVDFNIPRTVIKAGVGIVNAEAVFPTNSTGVRYINHVINKGTPEESVHCGNRVNACSGGVTIVSTTRISYIGEDETYAIRLLQTSGGSMNVTLWWDIELFPTLEIVEP